MKIIIKKIKTKQNKTKQEKQITKMDHQMISKMKVDELKILLRIRGLKVSEEKELVAPVEYYSRKQCKS